MANKRIKGLTVEIGGDTTKLGDALKDVEKKSKNLSGELGEINRLLKLDPKNTELLSQKQKVLADAIKTTASKLDTLREAEKDVQKQFEKGEVSEEQVRALQREIIATEKKLKGYEDAAEETADALKGLDKETEAAEESTEGLGKKMGSLAKGGAKVLAAGVTAVTGALVASAEASREYRTEMGKLEAAYRSADHSAETATKTYKTLQSVIGETDQSVEAAQQIALLAESEEDAAKWADLAAGVFGKFGDALQPETFFEAANETAKLGEATGAYTQMLEGCGYDVEKFNKGLAACNTEAEKQAYMLDISQQLLGEAGDVYREVNGEVIRANQANEEWAASMAGVGAEVEPILSDVKLLGASLVKDMVPGVKAVSEAFRGMLNGDDGAAADLGAAFSGIFTQLLTKITEMLPKVAEVGLSLITTLATSILDAVPQVIATGAQVVGTLITGLVSALPTIGAKAFDIIEQLVNGLQQNLPAVLEKGAEMLAQLGEGIRQNLPRLVSRALDIVMNFAQTIYDAAPKLISMGFELIGNLVGGIMDSLPVLLQKAPEIVSKFANVINHNAPTILMKGAELVLQLVKGILKAIPTLVMNIPKIIKAIVDVWMAFNWLQLGKNAINSITKGWKAMIGKLKTAGKSALDAVNGTLKSLPSKLLSLGKNAIKSLGNGISNMRSSVVSKMKSLATSVVNTLKTLPSKVISVGKNLVTGLWNGVSNKLAWLKSKLKSFTKSVLKSIKDFFGVHSPSRETAWIGEMLDQGLAKGVEDNMKSPVKAMRTLSGAMLDEAGTLNGLTLERQLTHTFAQSSAATAEGVMLSKLDSILAAIERGQVLLLDGDAVVGGTVNRMDAALGRRRALTVRRAI